MDFMNKNIKRIIAITLAIGAYKAVSAITPGTFLDITTKPVYASSYSPNNDELKSLNVKSTNGDTLDLCDGYNGSTVKLNEDKEYYVKLTDDSDGIKINAKAEDSDYVVRIFTSDKADATGYNSGDEIPLGKGDTTLYVRTYESLSAYRKAKDSNKDVTVCEKEYTVNVMKTTASSYEDDTQDSIYLEDIELNKGDITFLKQRTSYDIDVDSSVSEIKITAPPETDGDRVRIDGSVVDDSDNYRKTVSLDDGKNEIKIKVTDDKDNQRTYTLNVTRGSSSSNNQDKIYLDALTISEGTLDFSAEDTSYDVDVDDSVSKVTIGATPEDEEYLVTINGEEVKSDDDYEKKISLSKGENTVKVIIQDEVNDKKRTYTLTINRGTAEDTKQTDTTTTTTTNTNTSTVVKNGWVQTDAGWKYNDENGKTLKNSWLFDKEVGVYCYLDADGLRVTGWFEDNGKWYLLDTKGAMLTGWQDTDGKRYLLDKNGAMRTGWYKEEVASQGNNNANISSDANSSTNTTAPDTDATKTESWYYLNDDGSMRTGWLLDGERWYYLNTDGIMQTGTKTIDGKICKFNTSGALII
jgi:glucan-binding YG repeat protein